MARYSGLESSLRQREEMHGRLLHTLAGAGDQLRSAEAAVKALPAEPSEDVQALLLRIDSLPSEDINVQPAPYANQAVSY